MSGLDATLNGWLRPLADALAALVFFEIEIEIEIAGARRIVRTPLSLGLYLLEPEVRRRLAKYWQRQGEDA